MHIYTQQVQIFRDVQLTSKFNIKRLRFTEYLASSNIQEFTIDQKYITLRLKIGQIFFCNFRAAGGRTGGICSKYKYKEMSHVTANVSSHLYQDCVDRVNLKKKTFLTIFYVILRQYFVDFFHRFETFGELIDKTVPCIL